MPAERTKRHSTHGTRLPWATAPTQTIEFAPNVTPTTFSEPPPLVDFPEPENCLFPPSAENDDTLLSSQTSKSGKKRRASYIPRPPNAFILFRSSFVKSHHVSTSVEKNHSTLSKIIGLTWSSLSAAEREVWYSKAKLALAEHRKRWPEYSFRPTNNAKLQKSSSQDDASRSRSVTKSTVKSKKKLREVPTDQRRCEQIARFLVEGLKGEDLDVAIEEFDKTNTPLPPVTRFDEPVTERMYRRRRSSSVPGVKPIPFEQAKFSPPPRRPSSCGPPDTSGQNFDRPFTFDNYGVLPRLDADINWNTAFNMAEPRRTDMNSFDALSPFDTARIPTPTPNDNYIFSPISPLDNLDGFKLSPSGSSYSGMSTPALSIETRLAGRPHIDPGSWTPVSPEYVPTPVDNVRAVMNPYDLSRGPVGPPPDVLDLAQLDFDLSSCTPATLGYPHSATYTYSDDWNYKPQNIPRTTVNVTWNSQDRDQLLSFTIPQPHALDPLGRQ